MFRNYFSIRSFLFLLVTLIFVFRPVSFMGDPGAGWHLRAGEWIWKNGAVVRDPFLFGSAASWIHNQWLSDAIFWMAYDLGGWQALEALVILLFLGLGATLIRRMELRGVGSEVIQVATLFVATILINSQWFLRPVIFSVILFSAFLLGLERIRIRKQLCWLDWLLAGILFVVWANLHPGFPLALAALGLSLIFDSRSWAQRIRFLLFSLFCGLVTIINPYGLALHFEILSLLGDPFFMNLNNEWLSPDFGTYFFTPLLVTLVTLVGCAPLLRQSKIGNFEIALLLVFVFSSLSTRRYIPFLGVVVVPLLAQIFMIAGSLLPKSLKIIRRLISNERPSRWVEVCGAVGVVVIALLTGTLERVKGGGDLILNHHPDLALVSEFIDLRQPRAGSAIFNGPNEGGALIWAFWPRLWPTIDDRNEVNGRARYERYLSAIAGDLSVIASALKEAGAALLPNTSALRHAIETQTEIKISGETSKFLLLQGAESDLQH